MSKKNALGGGLDSLLSLNDDILSSHEDGVKVLNINEVKPNPFQPRKTFNEETLMELSESIKSCGVIQPIIVEESYDGYTIIAGERRYRACKLAGLEEIPVLIKDYTEEEKLEIALIENIQREDLTPIEEAKAYKNLMDSLGLNQENVAHKVGKKRSTIANALRLLKLPEYMQQAVDNGGISAGHARAVLALKNDGDQRNLYQKIKNEGLSVRETEKAASRISKSSEKNTSGDYHFKEPEMQSIEQKFIDVLGTKVTLKGSLKKGKIEISYFSTDDLERIIDLIS